MKTLFFILIQVSFLTSTWGQMTVNSIKNGNYGTVEQRAQDITNEMTKGLKLTAEQQQKVHQLNLKYSAWSEEELVKNKTGMWARYRKLMSIQEAKDKDLKPILTAEQFKLYQKRRDELVWEGVKAILW
jgi:DNA-directed RNA polymerase subunit F